jgi:quercetin dioxygenase-like cupin family protein
VIVLSSGQVVVDVHRNREVTLPKAKDEEMDENEFEAQLKADGYTEIETQTAEPRPGKGRHRHRFAIRGLVLSGTFFVIQDGMPKTYGPGQIFEVAEGELHDEAIGPDGARLLVGRKFSKSRSDAGMRVQVSSRPSCDL